jgi:hypothetical protein
VSTPDFCPVHGEPNDPLQHWPCPVALEGDPPDKQTCTYFEAELQRRMDDVAAGNFYELTPCDEDGYRWFVGHGDLAGKRRLAWSRSQVEPEGESDS